MAVITTYSTAVTAIADWLARSDLNGFIPNFIQNWEEAFYRDPKNHGRWMEASLSDTIAASVIPCPADYLAMKYAYVNGAPSSRLERKSLNQLLGSFPRGGTTGMPLMIARDGENFIFGPEPDSTYTIKGTYYAKPTLLRNFASDAAANYLILNCPDLIVYGALIHAAPFLRNDSRLPIWGQMYDMQLTSYRNLNRDEDISGSPSQETLARHWAH